MCTFIIHCFTESLSWTFFSCFSKEKSKTLAIKFLQPWDMILATLDLWLWMLCWLETWVEKWHTSRMTRSSTIRLVNCRTCFLSFQLSFFVDSYFPSPPLEVVSKSSAEKVYEVVISTVRWWMSCLETNNFSSRSSLVTEETSPLHT